MTQAVSVSPLNPSGGDAVARLAARLGMYPDNIAFMVDRADLEHIIAAFATTSRSSQREEGQ